MSKPVNHAQRSSESLKPHLVVRVYFTHTRKSHEAIASTTRRIVKIKVPLKISYIHFSCELKENRKNESLVLSNELIKVELPP